MDNRVRDRRRAVHQEKGRRRAGWVLVGVAVLIALGLFLWLRSSDVFAVKRVTATPLEHMDAQVLAQATASAMGVSLLRVNVKDIQKRLLEIPYVRSAAIHREFPNTLAIVVKEYEPAACVRDPDGKRWLVGDDGRVLEQKNDPSLFLIAPESDLALKPGDKVPSTVAKAVSMSSLLAQEDIADLLPEVLKISVSKDGEITLLLKGSIELRLGDPTELKQKLKVAGTIIQQYLKDGKPLRYVDARVPDRVAVNKE
ncbi:MAG: FtsQ-type POTRA domain-containing protein [Actinobacteria bacterium]|nr:FtsQ-type POTRA domain-containing protein [Actinomycetota bacterium]